MRLLKWVGAKQRLLPQLIPLLPREFNAYHEPFAGSAALFLALGLSGKRVHLNDVTAAVAALYHVIQHQAQELKDMLAAMAAEYTAAVAANGREGGKAYFDAVKAKYNERPPDTERAAMLVFLMHMSFCSLYSENDQGKALVYFGPTRGKADTRFYFPAKIDRAAAYFSANDVRASCGDFEQVLQDAAAGDFVFLDPLTWAARSRDIPPETSQNQTICGYSPHLKSLHAGDAKSSSPMPTSHKSANCITTTHRSR